MSQPLWAIDHQIQAILAQADESGELPGDLFDVLDALAMERKEKVAGIVAVIRNSEASAAAVDIEIRRLEALRRPMLNTVERLEAYLLGSMKALNEKSIDCGPLGRPRRQNNSQPSVKFAGDIHEVEGRFKRIIVELDRVAVLAAHKAGEVLPDGLVIEVGEHLRLS